MTSLLRILRFAPQLHRLYLGIAVSSVLAAVLTLATPFLIGAATDRIVAAIAGETTVEDAVVAVDVSRPDFIYAVGGDGTPASSTDAGATWTRVERRDAGRL